MARLDNLDYEVNGGTVNYEIVPEIAPLFNATTAYAAGDQVIHEGIRCKFTTAHPAGAWIGTDVEEMPTVAEELTSHGADITELKADFTQLDGKIAATQITNTASGAIASFPDGADGVPVKDLVVDIEPVQNLHGQANPYPGGGSKNLFDWSALILGSLDANGDYITNDNRNVSDFLVLGAGTYTISRATTANTNYWKLWSYNIDGTGATLIFNNGSYILNNTFTLSEQKKIRIAFDYIVTEADKVQLETGSTVTSYVPYENICPISGWTGANVARTGKNLYCGTKATGISIIYGGKNNAATVIDEDYTFKPGTYRVSLEVEGTSNPSMFFSTKVGGVWSNPVNRGQTTTFTFTVPENCEHLEIWGYGGSFTAFKNIQIELGSETATVYEPSNGETVNIDWTTEAGTVYGGTLDVTSGVLTVDRACDSFTLSSATPSSGTGFNGYGFTLTNRCSVAAADSNGKLCNLTNEYSYSAASYGKTHFYITSIGSANLFVPEGTSRDLTAQFCYPLETPQTYQLTPTEVSTLLGLNNIWADCGDTTVDYRADTKLYIEKLTAPTEDDMIANTNIPSDTYFMIGNTLFLSTTTIPAGDTINPGTNCTKMDLAAALNAINA